MKNLIEVHNQLKAITAAVGELVGIHQVTANGFNQEFNNRLQSAADVEVAATYPQMQTNCHINEKGQLVFGSSNPINLMNQMGGKYPQVGSTWAIDQLDNMYNRITIYDIQWDQEFPNLLKISFYEMNESGELIANKIRTTPAEALVYAIIVKNPLEEITEFPHSKPTILISNIYALSYLGVIKLFRWSDSELLVIDNYGDENFLITIDELVVEGLLVLEKLKMSRDLRKTDPLVAAAVKEEVTEVDWNFITVTNISPETKEPHPDHTLVYVPWEDMTIPYDFAIFIRGDMMLMIGDLVHHIIRTVGVGLEATGVPYVDVCSGKVSEKQIELRSLAIGLLGNRDKLKDRVINQVLLERLLTDAMNSETSVFNGILAVAGLKRNDINNGTTVPGVVFMASENLSNCCLFLVYDIMQVSHLLANGSNVNKIKHLAII